MIQGLPVTNTTPIAIVDGLKLTFSGDELRERLAQRVQDHERRAQRWKEERQRTAEDQTEDRPLLPDHMCENEAERALWQANMLTFIREHIEAAAV